jgi:hypothetical protein
MDYSDYGVGLINALSQGLQSYNVASDKRQERELRQKQLLDEQEREKLKQQTDLANKAFFEGYSPEDVQDGMMKPGAQMRPDFISYKEKMARLSSEQDPYGLKAAAAMKAKSEAEESARKKTPQGKIEGLAAAERQRFDNLVMAKNAFEDAKTNFEPTKDKDFMGSLKARAGRIGMSKYAEATNRFKEGIGRLQSGGAINSDEGKSFIALLPTAKDSDEIAEQKLTELGGLLKMRLQGMGLEEGALQELGYLKKGLVPKKPTVQETTSQVSNTAGPKPGDVEAGFRFKGGDPANPNSWERMSAGN